MKNKDVIVAPERNGYLNPTVKSKYRDMATSLDGMIGAYKENSLDGLIGQKTLRENSSPWWSQDDVRYASMTKFCERLKPSLVDDLTGRISTLKCCKKITEWGGVLIPVVWDEKRRLEGAVHIRKEEKNQSWVYLNVDTTTPEFMFSALRELGRLLIISLSDGWRQEYACRLFAASILINEEKASEYYNQLQSKSLNLSTRQKVNYILGLAIEKEIPPLAILSRLDKFAYHHKRERLNLDKKVLSLTYEFARHFSTELSRISCQNVWHDDPKNKSEYEILTRYYDSDFMIIFDEYCSSMSTSEKSRLGAQVTMMDRSYF